MQARVKPVPTEIRASLDIELISFYNATFPEEIKISFQLQVLFFKTSTMVEGLKKREFLMMFGRLQLSLVDLSSFTVTYEIISGS